MEFNKINWEFSHNDEVDAIWKGTTEKGAVLYAIKRNHELQEITVRKVPKKERILTEFDIKLNKAKEFVKSLDRNTTFVMYEKSKRIRHYFYRNTNSNINLKNNGVNLRIYGWTIVAEVCNNGSNAVMNFYTSVCSKKDNFCKQIAIMEAFNNIPIYSINIPFQSFNDNLRIFNGVCKELLIYKIEKKAKLRI